MYSLIRKNKNRIASMRYNPLSTVYISLHDHSSTTINSHHHIDCDSGEHSGGGYDFSRGCN